MSPTQRRKAAPAEQPKIQDRPAPPAQKKAPKAPVLDPGNRDGEFIPNPAPGTRQGPPRPTERHLRVVGPKPMGPDGVKAPGWLVLELTDPQLDALLTAGHVEDWDGVEGWGEDDAPDPETEATDAPAEKKPDTPPADEPKAGAKKEGN